MPWTPPKPTSTHVYKTVDGVDVSLDLYLPTEGSGTVGPAPVIVWFHPGSWVDGAKSDMAPVQLYTTLKRGWAFISADYRLAPQVKLKDLLSDAVDAVVWVTEGNLGNKVDPKKIVVSGSSAGGLVALVSGHQLPEPPLAMFAIYPAADLTLPSFTEKVNFPKRIEYADVAEYLDPKGPVLSGSAGTVDFSTFTPYGRTRASFYLSQEGNIFEYILSPGESPAPYVARQLIKATSRIVTIHGTTDKMVPFEVSQQLDNALEGGKMDHLLIPVEGADHGFDLLIDPEDPVGRKPFEIAMDWLSRFV